MSETTPTTPPPAEPPQYPHDCPDCRFLGRWVDRTAWDGVHAYDLYACPKQGGTVVARWGSEGAQYTSSALRLASEFAGPLWEAMRRVAAGTFAAPAPSPVDRPTSPGDALNGWKMSSEDAAMLRRVADPADPAGKGKLRASPAQQAPSPDAAALVREAAERAGKLIVTVFGMGLAKASGSDFRFPADLGSDVAGLIVTAFAPVAAELDRLKADAAAAGIMRNQWRAFSKTWLREAGECAELLRLAEAGLVAARTRGNRLVDEVWALRWIQDGMRRQLADARWQSPGAAAPAGSDVACGHED